MVARSPALTFEPFLVMTFPKRAPTFGIVPGGRGATTPSVPSCIRRMSTGSPKFERDIRMANFARAGRRILKDGGS